MPDRDMTTDKPGEAAVEAATFACRYLDRTLPRAEWPGLDMTDGEAVAAIIQAAIDKATAAVEAERDKAQDHLASFERIRELAVNQELPAERVAKVFLDRECGDYNSDIKRVQELGQTLRRLTTVIERARLDGGLAMQQERDEALATIQRNLEISTATEALLRETAEQRNDARAERDRWCQEADARTSTLANVRQQRDEARAAARELATAVRKAGEMMKSVKIFVNNREKIKQPEGRELYDAAIADTEIALTKHAALLAEPERETATKAHDRTNQTFLGITDSEHDDFLRALKEAPWYIAIAEGIAGERLELMKSSLEKWEGPVFVTEVPATIDETTIPWSEALAQAEAIIEAHADELRYRGLRPGPRDGPNCLQMFGFRMLDGSKRVVRIHVPPSNAVEDADSDIREAVKSAIDALRAGKFTEVGQGEG